MINIALFAADEVGLRIARLLGGAGACLSCLVMDVKDLRQFNSSIRFASNARVCLLSDQLDEPETLQRIQGMHLDLIILAWWPYLIKKSLFEIPRLGALNTHPSYLPHNRGKHPNFWSLVEGAPYGVSLHFVDAGIDSGDIAYQRAIPTTWEDTGKTLHDKGKEAIVDLFRDKLEDIVAGHIPRTPQFSTEGSFHRAAELQNASRIDLDRQYEARRLLNVLRARTYPPYPAAWFEDGGEKYEVRVEIRRVSE